MTTVKNLSDILLQGAERWPERQAVADADGSLTYSELAEQSARVAGWLISQKVAPGDRVVIRLRNSVRFVVAHFAVQFVGAVSTPLDPSLPPPQFTSIVGRSEAKVVLDDSSPWDEMLVAAPNTSPVQRADTDLAALMFTTGTTGEPKGVMLSHANILAALRNIVTFVDYTQQDREVITLPLTHNFGLSHVYCNLMSGGAVYLENGMARVGRVLKAIESFGATGFPTTPRGVALLLDRYREAFIERARGLRFMVVNSAPLPPEMTARLQAALPDLNILVYYGLTEASRSTFISLSDAGSARYASVGRAMSGVKIRLDESGQVRISGATVTSGYWRNAELTEAKLPGGELQTGDLGRFDAEGNLYITGRADDIINLGGYKINPLDVERVIEQCSTVQECAVAGGEDSLVAYCVSDEELDTTALTQHCRKHLQPYETPTSFIGVGALPRTDSGKLKRNELIFAGG